MSGSSKCALLGVSTNCRSSAKTSSPQELHTAPDALRTFSQLKRSVPTFTLDCTEPELDDVVVEPPEEFLSRLRAAGKCANIWWKLERQLPGRRHAGQRCVDHFTGVPVSKPGFTKCASAPQFCWSAERQVGMEVHMDDVHGFGTDPQVEKFMEDLAVHIRFRDGGVHHDGSEYDHLKRFHKKFNGVTTIASNPKYLDAVLELLGL